MVTPYVGRRKVKEQFFNNDFLLYKTDGVASYFPTIGSTFCYHIVKKANNTKKTLTNVNGILFDLTKYGFIPNKINPEIERMLDKLMTGTPLKIQNGGVHSTKSRLFSDQSSSSFPYKYQHTGSQIKYCSKKCTAMEHSLKVVCSKSGYLRPWLDKDGIGITEGSWCIPVSSELEGNKIVNFLSSSEVKLFNELSGSNTAAHDPNKYKLLCI
jgi:hypothetical protein